MRQSDLGVKLGGLLAASPTPSPSPLVMQNCKSSLRRSGVPQLERSLCGCSCPIPSSGGTAGGILDSHDILLQP